MKSHNIVQLFCLLNFILLLSQGILSQSGHMTGYIASYFPNPGCSGEIVYAGFYRNTSDTFCELRDDYYKEFRNTFFPSDPSNFQLTLNTTGPYVVVYFYSDKACTTLNSYPSTALQIWKVGECVHFGNQSGIASVTSSHFTLQSYSDRTCSERSSTSNSPFAQCTNGLWPLYFGPPISTSPVIPTPSTIVVPSTSTPVPPVSDFFTGYNVTFYTSIGCRDTIVYSRVWQNSTTEACSLQDGYYKSFQNGQFPTAPANFRFPSEITSSNASYVVYYIFNDKNCNTTLKSLAIEYYLVGECVHFTNQSEKITVDRTFATYELYENPTCSDVPSFSLITDIGQCTNGLWTILSSNINPSTSSSIPIPSSSPAVSETVTPTPTEIDPFPFPFGRVAKAYATTTYVPIALICWFLLLSL